MHFVDIALVLVAAGLLATSNAQYSGGNASLTPAIDFSQIPTCGLICMAKTAPSSGCSLADVNCICKSKKMTDLTTKCALAECSAPEAFKLLQFSAKSCQYSHEDKSEETKRIFIGFATLTKIVVPTRVALRLYTQGKLGWDDGLIVAALCTDTVAFYASMRVFDAGLGKHIWDVDPNKLGDFLVWSTISMATYIVTSGLIKVSILALYLNIFTVSKRFRLLCWLNIGLCIGIAIPFVTLAIFQCRPISNTFDIAPKGGYCVNLNAATWSHSTLNVFTDFVIVVLPMMEVIALQMSRRKKLGVCFIFFLGGLVVVASIARLFFIPGFGRTSDPTWSNVPTFLLSSMELGVGQVCACLPAIYSSLRLVWPGFHVFARKHISQRGTTQYANSQDEYRKGSRLSGIPGKAKYVMASHESELRSRDGGGRDMYALDELDGKRNKYDDGKVQNIEKELPKLPQNGIEASTTVSVTRSARTASYDGRF